MGDGKERSHLGHSSGRSGRADVRGAGQSGHQVRQQRRHKRTNIQGEFFDPSHPWRSTETSRARSTHHRLLSLRSPCPRPPRIPSQPNESRSTPQPSPHPRPRSSLQRTHSLTHSGSPPAAPQGHEVLRLQPIPMDPLQHQGQVSRGPQRRRDPPGRAVQVDPRMTALASVRWSYNTINFFHTVLSI